MQAIEENLSVPDVLKDAAYTKALHYRLSTSQVYNNILKQHTQVENVTLRPWHFHVYVILFM